MQRSHNINVLHHGSEINGIGRITTVAQLEDSSGTPGKDLRTLGCYALVYVQKGQGFYEDSEQCIAIGPANLILLRPTLSHRYKPTGPEPWNETFMLFEGSLFEQWERSDLLPVDRPVLKLDPIEFWLAKLNEIYAPETTALQQITRLQNFLADALTHDSYQIAADQSRDWLARAEHHLRNHLDHSNAVQQSATDMGLSHGAFRKKYSRLTDHTPAQFILKSKMHEGARLLIETNHSIEQIADQLNYCDQFHFSKRFKNYFGTTPSKYRIRIKDVSSAKG